ncbi:hypothetical protein [Helicobacter didelphidarum]|nr:hypothetical protein [Helicobacter didelphidarum]
MSKILFSFFLALTISLTNAIGVNLPKCMNEEVIKELEKEFIKEIRYEIAGDDELRLRLHDKTAQNNINVDTNAKAWDNALKKLGTEIFISIRFTKFITNNTDNQAKKVICQAQIAEFKLSLHAMKEFAKFVAMETLIAHRQDSKKLSKEESQALKVAIDSEIDAVAPSMVAEMENAIKSQVFHYSAQHTDDGFVVVEILDE